MGTFGDILIQLKPGSSCDWSMFGDINPKLGILIYDTASFLSRHGVDMMEITSLIRPKEGDSGVHAVGRGVDISVRNIPAQTLETLVKYINDKYPYDKMRPNIETAIVHTASGYGGDKAMHLHIQTMA